MERKAYLLSNLKKQVTEMKNQLNRMGTTERSYVNHKKWINSSDRFNSHVFGS